MSVKAKGGCARNKTRSKGPAMTSKMALTVVTVGLLISLVLFFAWTSAVKNASDLLLAEYTRLKDSVAQLDRTVDSVRAAAPGLGEYMTTIQLHVSKLWFAAGAMNWKLGKYELDELNETMEAAEALHARKHDIDVSAVLESVRQTQLPLIDSAIAAKSGHAFRDAYAQTLAACNGCHRPAGYGFIHIIVPVREPVTNQQWSPEREHSLH
jgi:hypothetical protein